MAEERNDDAVNYGPVRTMTLTLDELDYRTIQGEIAKRQAGSRAVDPKGPTIIPEGESCLAGALIAEMIRELDDYRAMLERIDFND